MRINSVQRSLQTSCALALTIFSLSALEKQVSPIIDEFQIQEKAALIESHRSTLSELQATSVNGDDWLELLRLNFHISSRNIWPSQELANDAETLQDDIFKYISSQEGYTDLVKKKILDLQQLKEAQKAPTYEMDMIQAFRLIEFLPAPEVVIMLGSLLEHDDGFFMDGRLTKGIHNGNASIAGRSIRTLLKFPLVDGPERPPPSHPAWYDSDMIAPEWQAWWQEILDGERTFQLEGDPNRYNHLGPVSPDWKPKSAALTASQSSPTTTARTPAPKSSAEPEIKAHENRYLWAGLALVAIAVLTWVITRIQRAPSRTS